MLPELIQFTRNANDVALCADVCPKTPVATISESVVYWIDTIKAGLAARFRMVSGVPFANLPALYQQASLFVYPSRFEGFGIPLLEALCSGTPVIGCTGSCLEEAGGPSSIYVDPDDATALAQAINDVLSDDELSSHMSSEGLKYAQQFEAEALTMNLLKEYSTLC